MLVPQMPIWKSTSEKVWLMLQYYNFEHDLDAPGKEDFHHTSQKAVQWEVLGARPWGDD